MDSGPRAIAVIGTGSIGMRHLEVLRWMTNTRPIAVPKRRQRLDALSQAGFATAADLQEAVREGATLGIVASETRQHVPDGLAASELGLDLLVEKPLASDAASAGRLCDEAKARGRQVFVGCVLRFSESLHAFRQLLPQAGRIHAVRIECQSYLPDWRPARSYRESYSARAEDGGVLRDLIHEVDYAGWLFGWPLAVQASLRNLGRLGIEAEEAAELRWETPEGCSVSISLDYLTQPSRRRMRATGEHGTLKWDGIEGAVTWTAAKSAPQVIRASQARDEMFAAQAQSFIQACGGVVDPRLATAEDGIKALAVCDAARRSSVRRREERVEYPSLELVHTR